MLFSQIIPPSHSPTESKRQFFTSVSLLLPHIITIFLNSIYMLFCIKDFYISLLFVNLCLTSLSRVKFIVWFLFFERWGHLNKKPLYPLNNTFHFPLPQPLATTILPSSTMTLTTLGSSYKWNHALLSYCDWLILHFIMLSRFIHTVTYGKFPFIFLRLNHNHCGASLVAQTVENQPARRDTWV